MARESSLWKWLSNARLVLRERVDLRRVEDSMGAGFPDVDGRLVTDGESFGFKLELKSEVRPAKETTPIRFKVQKRQAQIEFMRRRYAMGEAAYFLLQIGEASEARRYVLPGDCGHELRGGILEAELMVRCVETRGDICTNLIKPHELIERIRLCDTRRLFR